MGAQLCLARQRLAGNPSQIIAQLDALSRKRALTLDESIELERAIRFEKKGPRRRYYWSPIEDEQLLSLRAEGVTFPRIAKMIGRSQRSCEHRAKALRCGS